MNLVSILQIKYIFRGITMQVTVSKEELYNMIKDAVREVIQEKELNQILKTIPEVSDEEMQEITDKYGSPDKYSDIARSETLDV